MLTRFKGFPMLFHSYLGPTGKFAASHFSVLGQEEVFVPFEELPVPGLQTILQVLNVFFVAPSFETGQIRHPQHQRPHVTVLRGYGREMY